MGAKLAWLAVFLVVVLGQSSNVQNCISSYNWTINSRGQTPCLVAAYLESGCGMPALVNAIPPDTHYIGPSVADADGCHCSSVTYSVVSACAGCQQRSYLNWTTWSYNCTVKYEASFPGTVFSGTSVPLWAYIDPSETNDTFDPVVAAENVSITLPSSFFPTTTAASTTTVSFSFPPTYTIPMGSSSSSSTPNLGAIIGGVLGGSAGVAIILLVSLVWYLKRRSRSMQKDIIFDQTALVSGQPTTTGTSTPLGLSHMNMTGSAVPSSPYSMSRRSLDGPSPSIRYFGSPLQPNRHPGSDDGHERVRI